MRVQAAKHPEPGSKSIYGYAAGSGINSTNIPHSSSHSGIITTLIHIFTKYQDALQTASETQTQTPSEAQTACGCSKWKRYATFI